jgi:MinD superfamily P-loop ATPase
MKIFNGVKIAITGGKGGTGKSTIAVVLASFLAQNKKVLLVDADVDCPGDNLLLNLKLKKIEDVQSMIPKFDKKKCIKCGKCAQVCREKAIIFIKGKNPVFIPDQCIGCRACKIVCPVGAISETKQKIGEILMAKKKNFTLIAGKMNPGVEESSLIVNAVKKFIAGQGQNYDYIITDTAAGTHCPVIAALLGNDFAFAVTEPTPLGAHDLNLILSLTKKLKIKTKIILNRANIGPKKLIKEIEDKNHIKIIAEIPYSKKIQELYSKGEPIKIKAIQEIIKTLKK